MAEASESIASCWVGKSWKAFGGFLESRYRRAASLGRTVASAEFPRNIASDGNRDCRAMRWLGTSKRLARGNATQGQPGEDACGAKASVLRDVLRVHRNCWVPNIDMDQTAVPSLVTVSGKT